MNRIKECIKNTINMARSETTDRNYVPTRKAIEARKKLG